MLTHDEWEAELGQQVRSLRLKQNIDQHQLADRAGIALNAVKNLETGKGATLRSLVKVLRVLNRADWVRALAPTVSISRVQMPNAKAPRRRASRRKNAPTSPVHRADANARQNMAALLSGELAKRADVSFAYAYGSFVTVPDGFRDIDIAVWFDQDADRYADVVLSEDLSRLVDVPVDVRIANAAPVSFLFHALRGQLLAVRDERLLADVMERTGRKYHDQAALVRLATRDAFAA